MAPTKQTAFRLSDDQHRKLAKLATKLGVSRANVIRIAINRLAEAEGVK